MIPPPPTPWPLPPDSRVVLLVGGSFDPPHVAHLSLPIELRDRLFPDAALVFIPAAASPFKAGHAQTPPQHRARMLGLAVDHLRRSGVLDLAVWTDEIDRGEPSFTIDTLRRANLVAPAASLRLVIGADQAAAFHRWRESCEILRLAQPLVLLRPPVGTVDELAAALRATGAWTPDQIQAWCDRSARTRLVDVSSTRIRDLIRTQGIDAVPGDWIDADVRAFIDQHGLYRA